MKQRILKTILAAELTAIAVMSVLLLAGCDRTDLAAQNKGNLTTPEVVGQTEDGKTVVRYHLNDPNGHDNYVYRIKGESTLSTGTIRPQGKTRVDESQALLVEDPQPHFIDPQKELERLKAELARAEELGNNYSNTSLQFMENSRNFARQAESNRVAISNLLNQFRK